MRPEMNDEVSCFELHDEVRTFIDVVSWHIPTFEDKHFQPNITLWYFKLAFIYFVPKERN